MHQTMGSLLTTGRVWSSSRVGVGRYHHLVAIRLEQSPCSVAYCDPRGPLIHSLHIMFDGSR